MTAKTPLHNAISAPKARFPAERRGFQTIVKYATIIATSNGALRTNLSKTPGMSPETTVRRKFQPYAVRP